MSKEIWKNGTVEDLVKDYWRRRQASWKHLLEAMKFDEKIEGGIELNTRGAEAAWKISDQYLVDCEELEDIIKDRFDKKFPYRGIAAEVFA